MRDKTRLAHHRAGFALPAVLTTLTILTLIYLTVIVATDDLFKETLYQKRELDFQLQALTAEAQLAYLATTEPTNRNAITIGAPRSFGMTDQPAVASLSDKSVQFLMIDGASYAWSPKPDRNAGALTVQVQDDAGLINLNFVDIATNKRLFEAAGLDANLAQGLAAEFQDYTDTDNLIHLGGAEKDDYRRENRPIPPNRPIGQPTEIFGLLAWGKTPPPKWSEVATGVTAQYDSTTFNINTAPPQVLQLMFGLTQAQTQAASVRRRSAPFYSLTELGLADDSERLYTYPNGRLHFTILSDKYGFRYTSRLSLTPESPDRPIWIELESLQRFTPSDEPKPDNLPAFPKPASATDAAKSGTGTGAGTG